MSLSENLIGKKDCLPCFPSNKFWTEMSLIFPTVSVGHWTHRHFLSSKPRLVSSRWDGGQSDGRSDGRQPTSRKKKTPCEEKVFKEGHGKANLRGGWEVIHWSRRHRVSVLKGSAESEWTRSRTVSPTVRAHRPSDHLHCVCVPTSGGDRAFTGNTSVTAVVFPCEETSQEG